MKWMISDNKCQFNFNRGTPWLGFSDPLYFRFIFNNPYSLHLFCCYFFNKESTWLRWKVESWFYIMNKIIIIIVVEAKKDWVKPQRLVICFPNIFAFGKMISSTLLYLFHSNKFMVSLSSWWFDLYKHQTMFLHISPTIPNCSDIPIS